MVEIPTTPRPDTLTPRRQAAHRDALRADWRAVVSTLSSNLGNGMVALIAEVSAETVSRWAAGESRNPRPAAERRVRDAYQVYSDLVSVDSPHTVRAWFMGANPLLADESPAEAIAANRIKAVLAAARAFRDE